MAVKTASRESRLKLHLERFRKKRGVSLESISETTKISRRFLEAIEAEQFDQLPGGVFNTSYLRQYAAAVGMEAAALLDHYRSLMEPAAADPHNGVGATGAGRVPAKRSSWGRWFRTPEGLSGSGA